MSQRRPTPKVAGRRALLAGAALALVWTAEAAAQTPAPAPAAEPGPDRLAKDELYMEADEVIRDDEAKLTTAVGSIEVRYNDRTLRADKLVYDQTTGVIRAYGNIAIVNDDGTAEFADEIVLDEEMRAGVALGFSARLQENVKIAAASVSKRNENVQELNKAIYTPCEICKTDGTAKTPTWSISADRVVRDKQKRIVTYRNARFRIKGVPLLYLPAFWHADPDAPRSSGFLVPKMSASDRRGFSYEQPYYWVISPSSDLTISPQFNVKVNPFLNLRARKRFYSGEVDLRLGYTNDRDFDGKGNEFGTKTDRSYILGRGAFRIDEKWRWGFTAERTSDDLIFDKYEVGNVYESRGPYIADDRRLISQVYAIRQDARSYLSTAAISIQGLRPGAVDPTTGFAGGENDRVFPTVAPLVEGHYEPGMDIAGGRLRFHGSAVGLNRDQSPLFQNLRLPGLDSQRFTGELDWRRTFTSQAGVRVEPYVQLRADAYNLSDIIDNYDGVALGLDPDIRDRQETRGLATVGADVTYPLYKRLKASTVVLEPVLQIAASPNAKQIVAGHDVTGAPMYLNEDSVAFEFDETTLFRTNKFPGYDLYEDGVRLNVAGRASILWDDGRRATALIGRSFRTKENTVFPERSGLRDKASDWVVAFNAQPMPGISTFARARLDGKDFGIHRLEAGANVATKYGSGSVRYLTDDFDINGVRRENLDLSGEVYVGKNWGVLAFGSRDMQRNAWVVRDYGVFYRDDCLRVDVVYRREDVIIGRLAPSESISVRLTLATLGGTFSSD
jgi:LPS-assembly protein